MEPTMPGQKGKTMASGEDMAPQPSIDAIDNIPDNDEIANSIGNDEAPTPRRSPLAQPTDGASVGAVSLATQARKRKRPLSLDDVEADSEEDDNLIFYLTFQMDRRMAKRLRLRYDKLVQNQLLRLKWDLYQQFHTIPPGGRGQRRFRNAYGNLLGEMFPYSLGFTVEERDPPDGASANTPFDTAVTFVIVVQQIPVLLVEYKPGQEALRTARGRSKADTQFRDELQEALRVVAKSLPPNVSFPHAVYGISAVGLHVRFYKAHRDADHQIVVEPPREDQPTGSKSRLSPTYLADAWNIRITDPQSVARLADVREHIIDIAKDASLAMDAFVAKMSKRFAAKNPRKRTYEDEDRGERRFPDNVIVDIPFEGTELFARADSD